MSSFESVDDPTEKTLNVIDSSEKVLEDKNVDESDIEKNDVEEQQNADSAKAPKRKIQVKIPGKVKIQNQLKRRNWKWQRTPRMRGQLPLYFSKQES